MLPSLLLFGGSFDPIHNGHLEVAKYLQDSFKFDSLVFLPCKIPLLKANTQANPAQRVEMLELMINAQPKHYHFVLDCCEVNRSSASYTITTLRDYRSRHPDASLNLLMGMDTFLQFPAWHEWENILSLANILLINRPGYSLSNSNAVLKNVLIQHQTLDTKALLEHKQGLIYHFDAGSYDLSSTAIRTLIKAQQDVSSLIPELVFEYIVEHKLYGVHI